nr:N-6 DNA methylase [Pararhodobacter sp. SW119]
MPGVSAALATARVLVKDIDAPSAVTTARGVLVAAIGAFWTVLSPGSKPREPIWKDEIVSVSPDLIAIADRIGTAAAGLCLEVACDLLGRLYCSLLPRSLRANQGSYYTPPALAVLLLQRATEAGTDWRSCRVLDPACGGGALLLPALRRLLAAIGDCGPVVVLAEVADRLRGTDLDPAAAWLAQVMIDAALLPWTSQIGLGAPRIVQVADSLDTRQMAAFDLIVGNPPYGTIALSGEQKARFARSTHGRANLYGLFLDRALDLVLPGGVIAYLTPTSCLGGEYYKNLRALLAREAPPNTIDFIVQRGGVFDACQETMLTTWWRGASPGPIRVSEIRVKGQQTAIRPLGLGQLPCDPAAPWPLPRRVAHALVAPALHRAPHRLEDWGYRVRTGPVDASRHKGSVAAEPAPGYVPLIWAEAVRPAGLVWPGSPRRQAAWFDARGNERLLVRTPALLLQRTTAPEQPRRLVAAPLTAALLREHGATAIENHVNLVEPIAATPPVSLEALAAFLGSAAADTAFRCLSGSVAVSAYELRALPLPRAAEMGPLSRMLLADTGTVEVEAECRRLYRNCTGS